ncbi:NAD(P)/FAD-dependent oxidoreductase [Spirosoma aerolatum]|uniref:NAD(P)/FAD-dependent oxidoreductase n=1 Tax=Spirosoma aerolatum TaxID=1211326 RepID=UPI0009ABD26A|nr:NAD(P)/FAD-dependent oxidoreductase [Spirosoma aerolatum]
MDYDVMIIGGSYAGLSTALVLGRSLRQVLVIDAGQPANRQTPHSHGFLTRDGATPTELSTIARAQLETYSTVSFREDFAVTAVGQPGGFSVTTANGHSFTSRKLVLATGLVDRMPDLPGFAECWGRSVLHCPYCHGYEVRNQPVGILANGDVGYEMATLIQHWNAALHLFTNGPATFTEAQRQTLQQLNILIIETPLTAIEHDNGALTALVLADGSREQLKALYARLPFKLSSDVAQQLGCQLTEQNLIQATDFGETTVPGVFAAGDATTLFRQVAIAVASGSKAGAWINRELIQEDLLNRIETNLIVG